MIKPKLFLLFACAQINCFVRGENIETLLQKSCLERTFDKNAADFYPGDKILYLLNELADNLTLSLSNTVNYDQEIPRLWVEETQMIEKTLVGAECYLKNFDDQVMDKLKEDVASLNAEISGYQNVLDCIDTCTSTTLFITTPSTQPVESTTASQLHSTSEKVAESTTETKSIETTSVSSQLSTKPAETTSVSSQLSTKAAETTSVSSQLSTGAVLSTETTSVPLQVPTSSALSPATSVVQEGSTTVEHVTSTSTPLLANLTTLPGMTTASFTSAINKSTTTMAEMFSSTPFYDCLTFDCGNGTCVESPINFKPTCKCPQCITGDHCELDNTNPPDACTQMDENNCASQQPGTCCYWPCSTTPPTCTIEACSSSTFSATTMAASSTDFT